MFLLYYYGEHRGENWRHHFFTGSTKLTTTEFPTAPMILFTDESCLPKASTCAYSTTFPGSFGYLNYNEFKVKMDTCIKDSFGYELPQCHNYTYTLSCVMYSTINSTCIICCVHLT